MTHRRSPGKEVCESEGSAQVSCLQTVTFPLTSLLRPQEPHSTLPLPPSGRVRLSQSPVAEGSASHRTRLCHPRTELQASQVPAPGVTQGFSSNRNVLDVTSQASPKGGLCSAQHLDGSFEEETDQTSRHCCKDQAWQTLEPARPAGTRGTPHSMCPLAPSTPPCSDLPVFPLPSTAPFPFAFDLSL